MLSSKVTLPAFPVHINGYSTGLFKTSGSNVLFEKTQHDQLVFIEGCKFSGGGTAINLVMTPSVNTYSDYRIRDCKFSMDSGVYGISLVGPREGYIANCTFYTPGNGIYMQSAVSPFVRDCLFIGSGNVGTAVYYDGDGLATSAGLVLEDCEIMGWDNGLIVQYSDWLKVTGCTIDYNNNSIRILSQDEGLIAHNYLGSVGNNPAIYLGSGSKALSPDYNGNITIDANHIVGHVSVGNLYDCIQIGGNTPLGLIISNNQINFWTRYGINFGAVSTMLIRGNVFAPKSGLGTHTIYNSVGSGDSDVLIADNVIPASFPLTSSGLQFAKLRENVGFTTARQGQFVTDGVSSTFVIAHGLATTPDSAIVGAASAAAMRPLRVTSVDATNINVATDAVYAAFGIYWQATRWQGA